MIERTFASPGEPMAAAKTERHKEPGGDVYCILEEGGLQVKGGNPSSESGPGCSPQSNNVPGDTSLQTRITAQTHDSFGSLVRAQHLGNPFFLGAEMQQRTPGRAKRASRLFKLPPVLL
ncbi:hypothetical protein DPEC_G00299800 [Dallia pectoralis]|uniref:Uncharacterized protein n=1 Tax=Dallia pectoralis TaxID=75939 RepID=A0ACC2FGB3_DALPE|nr:hypothetical protein DPEC_G00299800 [Dallia pectoralis]